MLYWISGLSFTKHIFQVKKLQKAKLLERTNNNKGHLSALNTALHGCLQPEKEKYAMQGYKNAQIVYKTNCLPTNGAEFF